MQTAATTSDDARTDAEDPPETIGRYRLVRRLGMGGMGVVWLADDPLLARRVAVKLQRADADADARRRAVREGRALAAVAHPNVLPVFEAGLANGRPYLVTEHVDGTTLRAHLAARPHNVGEILGLFRAAGRGLAALHAAGLVHCDFKPDNVLISERGGLRVLVCDLGLAAPQPDDTRDSDAPIEATMRVGLAFGTVRYMAPEQHRGEQADARADQYAFCVALFEALYREPPFFALSPTEMFRLKLAGLPPPPDDGVQSRLHDVLARGLAPDPAARFVDMPALLAAIAAATRTRRRWLVAVPLATLAVIGWLPGPATTDHLDATALAGLADAVPHVHAQELIEAALAAEREGDLEGSLELGEHAYEVALADGDDTALALAAATTLRRVVDFRRDAQLAAIWRGRAETALALAPDELAAWHEYDEGRYSMEFSAGKLDAAQEACDAMLARARLDPIDGARAELAALEFEGTLDAARGDLAAADAAGAPLVAAARAAFGNDQNETALALLGAGRWAMHNRDGERALALAEEAGAIYLRTSGPDHARNLQYHLIRGWALATIGDNAAAFASLAEAEDLRRRWSPDAIGLGAEIANTMGGLARRMHDYERARTLLYRALTAVEAEFGGDPLRLAPVLHNLSFLEEALGNCPKARDLAARADAMHAQRLPASDPLRVATAAIMRCKDDAPPQHRSGR